MQNAEMPGKIRTAKLVFQTVGWMGIATAVFWLFVFVFGRLLLGLSGEEHAVPGSAILGRPGLAIFGVSFLLAALYLPIARGLARKKTWAKVAGIILAFPMLAAFPVGTILGIFVLLGLWSKEARSWFAGQRSIPDASS